MEIHAVDAVTWHGADDEVLAARVVEDFEAFAELYRRHASVTYKAVRARTPSNDVAEDITAQVFLKALINANDWRGEGTYRAWIFRIARDSISTWRAQERRRGVLEMVEDLESRSERRAP